MGLFGNKKNKLDEKFFKFDATLEFKSSQRNDYSEDAFTFRHANILITIAMAKNWFGEDSSLSADKIFGKSSLEELHEWAKEIEINKSLLNTNNFFDGYHRISWSESKIGSKFQAIVEKLGAKTHLMPSPNDLSQDVLTGNWSLCDGRTLIQLGDVWKNNTSGHEFIYWHIDALVRTRPPMSGDGKDLATQVFLPYMFQSAAYLSESPFPSTPIVMRTREQQFGLDNFEDIPKLAFLTEENSRNFGTVNANNQMQAIFLWAPQITHYGYIIEDKHLENPKEELFITILDALPKVGDILADGYCNWGPDSELNFQASCYSDRASYSPEEYSWIYVGEFVPGSLYAELDIRSQTVYSNCSEALRKGLENNDIQLVNLGANGLYNLMRFGFGSSFVHSINSLFYTQFSNSEGFFGDRNDERFKKFIYDSESVLKFATSLPIDFQDANAYSNLAWLYIDQENFEEAQKCVDKGTKIIAESNLNKSVSLLWSTDPKALLPVKLELMMHQVTIFMSNDENDKADRIASDLIAIAKENDYEDGSVLAAKYILGLSDTGTSRN